MNISISNLAWDPKDDIKVSNLLASKNIRLIDIAPSKYFKDTINISKYEILELKKSWMKRGISIVGMQSLLFGKNELNLFSSETERKYILKHLESIFRIADILNARKLTFGSPKNRLIGKVIKKEDSENIAINFFNQISELSKAYGITLCIEPVPIIYGCNFLNKTIEVYEFLQKLNNKTLKIQLDTASIEMSNENPLKICKDYKESIGHIHISQKFLSPINNNIFNHDLYSEAINKYLSKEIISIEMLVGNKSKLIEIIANSINVVKEIYLKNDR